ncbi:MAG: hypothetical protein C0506_03145 [Anaerolinea sp.]|nr:hypothetical protein [Anaerolinea sp.]
MTAPAPRTPGGREEHPLIAWAKAIALGVRDTAEDMLAEGRRGAHQAYNEYWDRFDDKTKHRRRRAK